MRRAVSRNPRSTVLPSLTILVTRSVQTSAGRRPQAIAHRGYKAKFPENSMGAFKGAVEVGAHAIETDVHLSKDGVVVLSHVRPCQEGSHPHSANVRQDASLKRCFGLDEKIANCDWSFLESLRTVRKPSQPMPRLLDLLKFLAQPGLEDTWILLDIKVRLKHTTCKAWRSPLTGGTA